MTGLPEFNFPAFNDAERQLRSAGFETLNPARHGSNDSSKSWLDYLVPCLYDVMAADGIALLDGHAASKGARVEMKLAEVHDKPVCHISLWLRHGSR
jgi:hypothetical protein